MSRLNQWRILAIPRQVIQSLRGWWSALWSGSSKCLSHSGPIAVAATTTSLPSELKSPACVSSSTELKLETSCPAASSIGPLQDSRIDSANSSGKSSPVQKVTVVERHGTIALVLASIACGAVLIVAMWLPYMLTASAAKAEARAQQAITTAELTKRDLEELKRRLTIYEETGRWVEK